MRKMTVNVVVKLIINADDGNELTPILENMDYSFDSRTEGADIEDTEIIDWEIKDSK